VEVVLWRVGEERLASSELVRCDLEGDFRRVSVGLVVSFAVGRLGQGGLVTETSTKGHFAEIALELFMMDNTVRVVVIGILSLRLALVIQVENTRSSDDFSIGSDITPRVKSVGTGSLERIGLASSGVERGGLRWTRIDGGNPELSDDHSTHGQSTGLKSACIRVFKITVTHLVGTDVFHTGKSLDGVHSSDKSISGS
jgi:hypothetical protein